MTFYFKTHYKSTVVYRNRQGSGQRLAKNSRDGKKGKKNWRQRQRDRDRKEKMRKKKRSLSE